MNKTIKILLTVVLLAAIGVTAHLFWLSQLNGDESYPADTYLDTATNKTALVIVAHDDDAIGCAGTISELTRKGWKVHFLTFYGNWRKEDNPIRKAEVAKVAEIQKLASTDLMDFVIQQSDTVSEPWRPIPYSKFPEYMKVDSLKILIRATIEQYKPSILFTLDNIIGGYGHPEHVCVSQSALDVSREDSTSVEKVYQAVFPPSLNENILKNNPAFIAAKKVYQAKGSPTPTTEISIIESSKEKKEVMVTYESQKRNLQKIWPYYNLYPHWIYFKIFDKEYFNVIDVAK